MKSNWCFLFTVIHSEKALVDFPGGPMVKNWPANAGEMGLILGPEGSHMLWSN